LENKVFDIKNAILPATLHESETWSLLLRERNTLNIIENKEIEEDN